MKQFEEMTLEEKQAHVKEIYSPISPEYKLKAQIYYYELLAEQAAQEAGK